MSDIHISLPTILKLKRTLSVRTHGPMGWREIGERIGKTGPGAQWIVKQGLGAKVKVCCPGCLRPLVKPE